MRGRHAVTVLLVMATLAVYGQVMRHDFVNFDDDKYVYDNSNVRSGLTWRGIAWAFTTTSGGNWHPLTWLSHMLDCELFGLNAGAHHLVNVLLHILNSILLFLVFERMTGAIWRSGIVAALFALHPLHVESVAWVAERKDVLSTLFFMLTLWAYVRYVARPSRGRYGLVSAFLALGLMAKPMLVTLPFVLLLLDYWPLGRFQLDEGTGSDGTRGRPGRSGDGRKQAALRLVAEKVPLLTLVAVSSAVTFVAQQRAGAMSLGSSVPVSGRMANALVAYVAYVGKMLWPSHLAVFYPYRHALPGVQWAGAALLLVALSVFVVWAGRRRRYLSVGWFWYLGTLVPVIGLVQVGAQSMADRYTYVPLIGLFLIAVWGAADLAAGWSRGRTGLAALAAVVIVGCMAVTSFQVGTWKNGLTLFEHASKVTQANAVAHNGLGTILMRKGETEEALAHFREAVRIDSRDALAHSNLGLALIWKGNLEEAVKHCQQALRVNPRSFGGHLNLGVALDRLGKREEAIAHYREALRLNPESAEAHNNLGIALMAEGRPGEAIAHYRAALRINPQVAAVQDNLKVALMSQEGPDEAAPDQGDAPRMRLEYAEVYNKQATLLAQQGKLDEAVAHYREAIRMNPDDAKTNHNLGVVLARQGKYDEAVAHFQEAVRLDPGRSEFRTSLALALVHQGKSDEAIGQYREAIRLNPGDPGPCNNLAWIRATHPDPGVRDGAEAVELAERACELSGDRNPGLLDTLASSYAEAGRFPEAIATLQEAIGIARSAGANELVLELKKRLQGYQAGRPYRETQEAHEQGEP